jgi:uncharacterized protein YkwD
MFHINLTDLIATNLLASLITFSAQFNSSINQPTSINLQSSSTTISISQNSRSPVPTPTPKSLYDRLSQRKTSNAILIPSPTSRPTSNPTSTPIPIPTIVIPTPVVYSTPTLYPTAPPIPAVTVSIKLPGSVQLPTPNASPTQRPSESTSVYDITATVNTYRVSHNRTPLLESTDICQVAQKRAIEADQNFSHSGFIEGVKDLSYQKAAENLWQGQPFSLDTMIHSWDNSPGHQQNLIGDYNYGCGVRHGNTVAFIFIKR